MGRIFLFTNQSKIPFFILNMKQKVVKLHLVCTCSVLVYMQGKVYSLENMAASKQSTQDCCGAETLFWIKLWKSKQYCRLRWQEKPTKSSAKPGLTKLSNKWGTTWKLCLLLFSPSSGNMKVSGCCLIKTVKKIATMCWTFIFDKSHDVLTDLCVTYVSKTAVLIKCKHQIRIEHGSWE